MLSCLIQNTPPRPKRDNSHFGIDEQYPKLEFKKTKLDVKGDEHRRGDCNGDSRSRGGMPPTPVLAPLEDPSRRPQAVQFQQELQGVYRQVGPDEMQYLGAEPISPGVSLYSHLTGDEALATCKYVSEIDPEVEDYMRDGYYSYLDGNCIFLPHDRPHVISSFEVFQNSSNCLEEQDIELV